MSDPGLRAAGAGGPWQEATASGAAVVYQAGRDQHFRFGDGVRRVVPSQSGVDAGCPYPGLAAFAVEQAGLFFGRDMATADLIGRLNDCLAGRDPLMVVAPSGAGKSSLLRAGLLHRVAAGCLTPAGSRRWPRVVFSPGADPMHNAAVALAAVLPVGPEVPANPGPRYLDELLRRVTREAGRAGPEARAVIVVDQFEELFKLCENQAVREGFISWLWQTADAEDPGGARAVVACGLRADFYYECVTYPLLRRALQANQVLLGSMSAGELRQAICYPARAAGLDIEPGLVEVLLRDLQAGQAVPARAREDLAADYDAGRLPLLAHVLLATWQQRHGSTLTVDGYRATGGIDHAIAVTAERVFTDLDSAGQRAARTLFLRMVKVGATSSEDVHRPVGRSALSAGQAAADAYAASRLLTFGRDAIQITHEALLRAWPRLRSWLNDDRAGNILRQDLEDAAANWDRGRSDPSLLYRGVRLDSVTRWADKHGDQDLSQAARNFLTASRKAARRAAILRRTAAANLAALALIASISSVIAFRQRSEAVRQRDLAISNEAIAAANKASAANPALAAQFLLQAYRAHPSQDLATRLISTANAPLPAIINTGGDAGRPVAFSPDGRLLALGTDLRGIRLWNTADPAHPRPLAPRLTVADGGSVTSVAFSPDDRTLAGESNDGTIRLWNITDPEDPRPLARLVTPDGRIGYGQTFSVAFSPDGHTLAGTGTGIIRLWNTTSPGHPRLLAHVPMHVGPIGIDGAFSVAFSPDGRTLATTGNGTIELWNTADPRHPRLLARLLTHDGRNAAASVAFSPDGRTLASSGNGTIELWNTADPRHSFRLARPPKAAGTSSVTSVAFSPDSRTLATNGGYGTIRLWNTADPRHPNLLARHLATSGGVESVTFSPDGRTLAANSTTGIRLWNLPGTVQVSSTTPSVVFSRDGRTLAADRDFRTIGLWNITDPGYPRPLATAISHSTSSLAISPDGRTLAAGSTSGQIRLWNISNPRHPLPLASASSAAVLKVAFSPDGRTLATIGHGMIRLWDISDPRYLRPLATAASPAVLSLAFSPDGRTIAAGTLGGAFRLWDISDPGHPRPLARIHAAAGHITANPDFPATFSPHNRTLAIGSSAGAISLWNIADPEHPRRLETVSTSAVNSMAFSPNGRTLATGSATGTITLWTITDRKHVSVFGQPLTAGDGSVTSVAFGPDNRSLASASIDGTIRIWNLNIKHAISRICRTTTITRQQWHQHLPLLPYNPPCQQ